MLRHHTHLQKGRALQDIGPTFKSPLIYQRGFGSYPIYQLQRRNLSGRGVGSVFAGLFRYLQPLLTKGMKSVAKEALNAGTDILANMDNQPVKELVKKRSSEALNNLKRKAVSKLDTLMEGSAPKKRIKRRKNKKASQSVAVVKKTHTLKRKRKNRRRSTPDIFS